MPTVPEQTVVPALLAVLFQATMTACPAGKPFTPALTVVPVPGLVGLAVKRGSTPKLPQARAPLVRPTPV